MLGRKRNTLNYVQKLAAVLIGAIVLSYSVNGHAETAASASSSLLSKSMVSPSVYGGDNGTTGAAAAVPDLFTGTFSYKIPIEVPPGRNGMEPKLELSYRSNNGNSWTGVGWQLELGAIQRSTRWGVDYSKDEYQLIKDGAAFDLVKIGDYDYRVKVEGEFLRIRKIGNHNGETYWEVTDKAGTRFRYGYTHASRVEKPETSYIDWDGSGLRFPETIFKWCLDWVIDTNGNGMTISYVKDPQKAAMSDQSLQQLYPDRIAYTENFSSSLLATNYVKFNLEERDDAPYMYTTNFGLKTRFRLKTIDLFAAERRVKAYKLEYDTDPNTPGTQFSTATGRSLLSKIRQFDKDADVDANGNITNEGTINELPAISMKADNGSNFIQEKTMTTSAPHWGGSDYTWAGDFNGDGKVDLATASGGTIYVKKSTGDSFVEEVWTTTAPNWGGSGYTWVGDFNGDGKMDIATANGGTIYVKKSTGNSFVEEVWTTSASHWGGSDYTWIGDFNGDGKADIATASGGTIYVKKSTGGSFVEEVWTTTAPNWGGSGYTRAGDFNGDGKMDIATANGGTIYVKKSTGSSFVEEVWTTTAPNWGGSNYTWVGDFNGDGLTDIASANGGTIYVKMSVRSRFSEQAWTTTAPHWGGSDYTWIGDFNGDGKADIATANGGTIYVKKSTGGSFVEEVWTTTASNWGGSGYTRAGDFNGDGKTDIATASGGTIWLKQSSDFPVDLVTEISNGIGGKTTIQYKSSTEYNNTQLPFPIQTVSSITTDDGNGNVSTTNYTYSGGFYHIGERDFRGFNYAKITGPPGPSGGLAATETWFHQGNDIGVNANDPNVPTGYMKGKPYLMRVIDPRFADPIRTGWRLTFLSAAVYYVADGDNAAPFFNPPEKVVISICDGDACGINTRTEYGYDAYGNLTLEKQFTNNSDSTEYRKVLRAYSPNATAWIVGLPSSETVYDGAGNQVAQKSFYYDGTTSCSTASTNQTPVKGNLTRVESWLDGGTSPETRIAYDNYGNPICTRDANGNISTITYDGSFTFPIKATNPLGQSVTSQYYGVDGIAADKGLYGQVKSITDPNSAVTTLEYDVFGRKTKETRPDNSWTSWSYNNFGTVGQQNIRTASSVGLWSETYFDGLGRTTKERKIGPDNKTIVSEKEYDLRGYVEKTSLPHFEGAGSLDVTIYYDIMGRPLRQEMPDSSQTLSCYNDGVTVVIDPNKHRKRETRDAFGRLVKVEEYTGTFDTCTTATGSPYATTIYQYDVLGNLRFVTDAKGNKSEMRYDTLSRKTFMHDPDMGDWTYSYDGNGSLKSQNDAKGQIIAFVYDTLNRITKKDYPSGTDLTYTYDETSSTYGKGRLTTMSDASGMTKYFYDNLGRTTKTVRTVDGVSYTIQAGYDGLDRVTSVTYPDNEVLNYSYDAGGNLWKAGSYATYTNYNALGQPLNLAFGNGVTTSYQYRDDNNRLEFITANSPTQGGLLKLGYGYDSRGNITTITDYINGARSQNFQYDGLDRLTRAQGNYGLHTYSYDQIGNILTKESVTFTYGIRPHAVVAISSGKAYTYDANGNMTSNGQRTITYDYDNMPKTINSNISFVYDGSGSRVKKIVGSTTRLYIDKLYECNGGSCVKYIFVGDTLIAHKSSTQTLYYSQDHLGSTNIVTDGSGKKVEETAYYPFGKTYSDTGTARVSHLFTSQELDGETGLYNYNARLYDPEIGRFISADSIIPDPSDPQNLNRYSYVLNNPLLYTDPTGNFDLTITSGGGGTGGGVQDPRAGRSDDGPVDRNRSGGSGGGGSTPAPAPPKLSSNSSGISAYPVGSNFQIYNYGSGNFTPASLSPFGKEINDLLSITKGYLENRLYDRLAKGYVIAAFIDNLGLAILPESNKGVALLFMGGVGKVGGEIAGFTNKMLSTSKVIAKGQNIRKVEELVEKFGGKAKDWLKKKGWDEAGNEWHWYENRGRRVGLKRPGQPDPF